MGPEKIRIGWGHADITPSWPVPLVGQFSLRISEGVKDPVTATALAVKKGKEHFVMVSCDLCFISDDLRGKVIEKLNGNGPLPENIIMNATHTHTAPDVGRRLQRALCGCDEASIGIEVDLRPVSDYVEFAAERIAQAVRHAWETAAPAELGYGLGFAVVGRNRRWVDVDGNATMYGDTNTPSFSHIEGYEDHSVNVLAAYDGAGNLTGTVINIHCPSQEDEALWVISADFWHDVRVKMKERFGEVYVLPQAAPCGDLSPHLLYDHRAEEALLKRKGITRREEIAERIVRAVEEAVKFAERMERPQVRCIRKTLPLDPPDATPQQEEEARREAARFQALYEEELQKLNADPSLRRQQRWFAHVTYLYRRARWWEQVIEKKEARGRGEKVEIPLWAVRVGEVGFVTNPFEMYLDWGIAIKARSPAVQTFAVQLCGEGGYLPSLRSTEQGGYGSIPASYPVDPACGRDVVEQSIEMLQELWS